MRVGVAGDSLRIDWVQFNSPLVNSANFRIERCLDLNTTLLSAKKLPATLFDTCSFSSFHIVMFGNRFSSVFPPPRPLRPIVIKAFRPLQRSEAMNRGRKELITGTSAE